MGSLLQNSKASNNDNINSANINRFVVESKGNFIFVRPCEIFYIQKKVTPKNSEYTHQYINDPSGKQRIEYIPIESPRSTQYFCFFIYDNEFTKFELSKTEYKILEQLDYFLPINSRKTHHININQVANIQSYDACYTTPSNGKYFKKRYRYFLRGVNSDHRELTSSIDYGTEILKHFKC